MAVSELLPTYLQDHHAGAVAGSGLARRAASSNEGSEYGLELATIADQIGEDREALEQVMDQLGVKANRIKDIGGWTAEKLGRLKPNNSLLSYSPLSRVIELEGLLIGVTAKRALWETLRETIGERLNGIDFVALAARADEQRAGLERLRRSAAGQAFERG